MFWGCTLSQYVGSNQYQTTRIVVWKMQIGCHIEKSTNHWDVWPIFLCYSLFACLHFSNVLQKKIIFSSAWIFDSIFIFWQFAYPICSELFFLNCNFLLFFIQTILSSTNSPWGFLVWGTAFSLSGTILFSLCCLTLQSRLQILSGFLNTLLAPFGFTLTQTTLR